MPGATPSGLPYPLPTEPVRDGATAIKNLADALEPRVPYKMAAGRGGFTTNANGGVSIAVPFPTVTAALATAEDSARGYSWNRATGAPAGLVWFNFIDVNSGQAVPNAFAVLNYVAYGS